MNISSNMYEIHQVHELFLTLIVVAYLFKFIAWTFSLCKITIRKHSNDWLPYILICHCTSLSLWFIILDKNNFVKVSHPYLHLTSGGYQVYLQPMPCGVIGMHCAKCKQSNSLTILLVHIFFCFMVIRPWLNLPTGGHGQNMHG